MHRGKRAGNAEVTASSMLSKVRDEREDGEEAGGDAGGFVLPSERQIFMLKTKKVGKHCIGNLLRSTHVTLIFRENLHFFFKH